MPALELLCAWPRVSDDKHLEEWKINTFKNVQDLQTNLHFFNAQILRRLEISKELLGEENTKKTLSVQQSLVNFSATGIKGTEKFHAGVLLWQLIN